MIVQVTNPIDSSTVEVDLSIEVMVMVDASGNKTLQVFGNGSVTLD